MAKKLDKRMTILWIISLIRRIRCEIPGIFIKKEIKRLIRLPIEDNMFNTNWNGDKIIEKKLYKISNMFFKKVKRHIIINRKRPIRFDGINMIASQNGPKIRCRVAEILEKNLPIELKNLTNESSPGRRALNASNVYCRISTRTAGTGANATIK